MDESGQILYKVLSSLGGADGDLQKADDSTVPLSQLCRICALPNEYLIPIFEGEGQENNLADRIHSHLPIRVNNLDDYPDHVCYQCASTLLAFHDLVDCCTQADITLSARVQLGQSKKTFTKELNQSKQDVTQSNKERFWRSVDESNKNVISINENKTEHTKSTWVMLPADKKCILKCYKCLQLYDNLLLYKNHKMLCGLNSSTSTTPIQADHDTTGDIGKSNSVIRSYHEGTSNITVFNCLFCEKQFTTESALKVHILKKHCSEDMQFQQNKHNFTCEICSAVFIENLKYIDMTYRQYKIIICTNCNIKQSSIKETTSQISNTNFEENINCNKTTDVCNNALKLYEEKIDRMFITKPRRTLHLQKSCFICKFEYKNHKSWRRHMRKYHKYYKLFLKPRFLCASCRFYGPTLKSVSDHTYEEHIPKINIEYKGDCKYSCTCKDNKTHRTQQYSKFLTSDIVQKFLTLQNKTLNTENGTSSLSPSNLTIRKVIECRYCPQIVHTPEENIEHKQWHFLKEPLKCKICNNISIGRTRLRKHEFKHKNKAYSALCPKCGEVFKSATEFYCHVSKKHNMVKKRNVLCQDCGKLMRIDNYNLHRKTFHSTLQKQCHLCGKIYKHHQGLILHQKNCQKENITLKNKTKCNTCSKKFSSVSLLEKHSSICQVESLKFQCDECSKRFPSEVELERHRDLVHDEVARKHKCQYCPNRFKIKATKIAHERIHTGERPYDCKICGLRFRKPYSLNRHEKRYHTNDKSDV